MMLIGIFGYLSTIILPIISNHADPILSYTFRIPFPTIHPLHCIEVDIIIQFGCILQCTQKLFCCD